MSILRLDTYHKQNFQLFPALLHSFLLLILAVVILAGSGSVTHAATLTVSAGGDLQKAINEAIPGDTILLEAGASFTGPFTLPNKGVSSEWITIRTSTPDSSLPSSSTRISPTDAPLLAKLLSPGLTQPALQTAAGAHHYRLIGLEIRPTTADALVYDLVKLGDGSSAQNSLEKVPHHLILDRCLITAFPTQTLKRGVSLNSSETWIINCYIAGFKSAEQDSQAVSGYNGPGPFHIINNYLEGAGENLMFGGATPWIAGLVPSDIEIKGNYLYKPLTWRVGEAGYGGVRWSVKNLFELKSARRVVFEGNVLENCWGDVFEGYGAISLTVRGDSGVQATLEDVTIRNNVMRHTPNGINILGKDTYDPSGQGRGLKIENNLFLDIDGGRWKGDGEFIKISGMPEVVVNHNTVMQSGNIMTVYGGQSTGLVLTNNILKHNSYGIIGQNQAPGSGTINTFFPGADIRRNVMVKADPHDYPSDNFFPTSLDQVIFNSPSADDYSLASVSPYKGQSTDSKDVGFDPTALKTASSSPSPSPSPTPTATPTPTPSITPTPTVTPTPTPTATPTPTPRPALTSPALVASALVSVSTIAANVDISAAQLAPVVANIEQAYAAFVSESSNFASADQIDRGLRIALYFARASYALCGTSVKVQSRLQITASRLSQVNNLMLSGSSSNVMLADDSAHAVSSASTTPIIGAADTRSSASFAPALAPASLATILGDPNQSPLSMQTSGATNIVNGNLPYELAGVSVTVGGRAAQVLSVSPARINFLVPAGLPAGDAEVLVTLQEGYVSRGTVTVAPIAPGIFTTSGNGMGAAVALDSITLKAGQFEVTEVATASQDKRTRLSIFTTGLSSGVVNTNTSNDLMVLGVPILNLAESVRVEARTSDGRLFNLAVEYAGKQSSSPGLDQVNIVLPSELKGAGAVELTVIAGTSRSNTATVNIK
jgi:uncharacterized protein (TIGR03437 family)